MMTRRQQLLAFLPLGVLPLVGHEDFRVVGVVTKVTAKTVDVKKKDGKVVAIEWNKQTIFTRDKTVVPSSALKVGLTVVVDATGDSEDELLAENIRIVPAVK